MTAWNCWKNKPLSPVGNLGGERAPNNKFFNIKLNMLRCDEIILPGNGYITIRYLNCNEK
jgi:hypothetical protein